METTYELMIEKKDFKIKKVESNKYKCFMIDKFKLLCGYQEIQLKNYTNVINSTKILNDADKNDFIKTYKLIFTHRGKTDPKLDSLYDNEKLLIKMLKSTFSENIFNKQVKIRTNNDELKYITSINYNSPILNICTKLIKYKRINKINKDLIDNQRKKTCLFIDDINALDAGI